MRYFFDWEFSDQGDRIMPISLGIVAEDGRELLLVMNASAEARMSERVVGVIDRLLPRDE